jgi:alkanesulfonate monooxygenase SsuD/methylene tetrahydromethanopterin reductase-like flavin-dependent oxidoreductase (luciferase family)
MRVGAKAFFWGWTVEELKRFWTRAEAAGFAHTGFCDHPIAAPVCLRAWHAPGLLVAIAARTAHVGLSVDVLITSWRRREIAVAQEEVPG